MLELNKINDIISNYEQKEKLSIDELMNSARVLSTQLYLVADAIGEAGKIYRKYNFERKLEFSRKTVFYSKENSISKSEHMARDAVSELQKKEVEAESSYEKGRLLFRSIDNVLQRMNQEIAEERKIRDQQKNY